MRHISRLGRKARGTLSHSRALTSVIAEKCLPDIGSSLRRMQASVPLRGGGFGVPPRFTAKFAAENTVETT